MKLEKRGCTRLVILTEKYAIKFPNFSYSLEHFLKGWLANISEKKKWYIFNLSDMEDQTIKDKLCPVLHFYLWNFLIVMPRCNEATDNEVSTLTDSYLGNVCTDFKTDNYGWLNGKLVCFDYGQ